MRHRLGRAAQLSGPFVAAGLQVATSRAIQVSRCRHVELGARPHSPGTEPVDPFVRSIHVANRAITGILNTELVRRWRQIGVGPVIPNGVAGVVDCPRQIVRGRSVLPRDDRIASALAP